MAKTWIVGIGSFYGNDNIGLDVTQHLENKYKQTIPAKDIYFFSTNAPHDLLALMACQKDNNVEHLYIIDAIEETGPFADINQYSLEDLKTVSEKTSSHLAGLQESLQLLRLLYFPELAISIIGVSSSYIASKQDNIKQIAQKISNLINTSS